MAGYISFVYTVKSALVSVVVLYIAYGISSVMKGSTRIQTTINSVAEDTHVLHDFPDAIITPRQEKRSRKVKQGNTYVTQTYFVTVYDVSNFISPNGQGMNTLTGLKNKPSNFEFPVKLFNGSVDGGTVEVPSKHWNPCITTLNHKGKAYENVVRRHDDKCIRLIGKGWDVYLQKDGSIKTNNAGAYGKIAAQVVGLLASTQVMFDVLKIALLWSNGFYSDYKLPDIFMSGELGEAGIKYATWWTRAYKADTGENCVQAINAVGGAVGAGAVTDVTNAAEGWIQTAETVTETAALAYLSSMASAKDVRNANTNMSMLTGHTMKVIAVRAVLLCLLLSILYSCLQRYVFATILKVEEGNDRPTLDYGIVACCAVIVTFMLRKYVYIAHSATIRSSFKKKVLHQLGEQTERLQDFKKRFHSVDFARIAI